MPASVRAGSLLGSCREEGARRVFRGLEGCWDRQVTGVDSAPKATARHLCGWGDGWPSRVRAVDAPALQDVPAREGSAAWLRAGLLSPKEPGKVSQRVFTVVAGSAEGCGPDSLWPIWFAVSQSEIRRVLAALFGGCGRSTVVFTEGVDSGPLDRGSAPEACEIGGLGTLARDADRRCAREGGVCGLAAEGTTRSVGD